MILTQEAAWMLLIVLVVILVVAIGLFFLSAHLARSGSIWRGGFLITGVIAYSVGPWLMDNVNNYRERETILAANNFPEQLELDGNAMLFVQSGNTICTAVCAELMRRDLDLEVYWVGAGTYIQNVDPNNALGSIIDSKETIVRLKSDSQDPGFSERRDFQIIEDAEPIPDFEFVIFDDDSGLIAAHAPDLLGLPESMTKRVSGATVIFAGWHDPYSVPPPAPLFRRVSVAQAVRPLLFWPFWRKYHDYPQPKSFNSR